MLTWQNFGKFIRLIEARCPHGLCESSRFSASFYVGVYMLMGIGDL